MLREGLLPARREMRCFGWSYVTRERTGRDPAGPDAIARCLDPIAEQVEWRNGGDYRPLFPDDAAELRGVWLPRLRAA